MTTETMRAVLTAAERQQVDAMLASLASQPSEAFHEGDFIQVAGSIHLARGHWLERGVYSVTRWTHEHLELKRYGEPVKVEVPHGLTLTKYPVGLVALSERARERIEAQREAVS